MALNPDKPIRISADPAWGWCAGLRHPPEADYEPGMFTEAQLEQLEADPALTLVQLGKNGEPLAKQPAKKKAEA